MEKEKKGFFRRIVDNVFKTFAKIDEELFEELEEALILADCGAATSMEIVERLRARVKKDKLSDANDVRSALAEIVAETLVGASAPARPLPAPTALLIIGVNGVGKTTTIGKLAAAHAADGAQVVLAAADTFRAAAIEQLEIWANRANCALIKHQQDSDPAAVVYDACAAARARKADLLIIDTAGRLHNKKNLMEELRKISKVIDREMPDAHRETFLVLDATTGQNGLAQAKTFMEITDISGIVLTKLDGTAKGGIVLAIAAELQIPVRYIGTGEQIADLQPFDAQAYARGLFFDD
ncbi:MAG: signal recognition particle-docking protein FtsY [Clostridiales bacterium]|jgi:fused signal recognition particle receptor|nr:signal recognition particle-docking protein FtsY [Clostridiales bacterium]